MLAAIKRCLSGWFVDATPRQEPIDALTRRFLRVKLRKAGLRASALCEHFGVPRLDSLRMDQIDEAMAWIKRHA